MFFITPFPWRRLTHLSTLQHRVDERGLLLLRANDVDDVPFTTATVRDSRGGFTIKSVESLGFVWIRVEDGDGWILRTSGPPQTMTHTLARWGSPVAEASAARNVDERLILVTIACEVGDAKPDAQGRVPAPRTEPGYPRRTGEGDHGDAARDAEDWDNFLRGGKRGIAHSSHGLMQTLISTAYAVRPDLFSGVDPGQYRDVLADPAKSIACGTAYLASFSPSVREDPLAVRYTYGAGSVRPSPKDRWGAVHYDELVPMWFVAFWNDLAAARARGHVEPEPIPPSKPARNTTVWVFAALSCFVLMLAASFGAARAARRVA